MRAVLSIATRMRKIFLLFLLPVFSRTVNAHCPLCTAGAAAAAGGAILLGVSNAAVGFLIGGFAAATGGWVADLIKRKIVPFQKPAVIIISFLTTVIPLLPLLDR